MPHHIYDVAHSRYYHTMATFPCHRFPLYNPSGLRFEHTFLRNTAISFSATFAVSDTLHINFMTSAVQQAVADIEMNDYVSRAFPDLGHPIVLLSCPVVTITAIGYDYSKEYISLHWMNLSSVSPHISRRGMPHIR